MAEIVESKNLLRQEMNFLLKGLSKSYRLTCGQSIADHVYKWLLANPRRQSLKVALFFNLINEVCTSPLADALSKIKAEVAYPIIDESGDLRFSAVAKDISKKQEQGLIDIENFDYIFVPGLAFDKRGFRLGRGKGHYDRALAKIGRAGNHPWLVGLAMDEQILPEIPIEMHDIGMDFLCTPLLGVIEFDR